MAIEFRKIKREDNSELSQIIKSTLEAQGNNLDGTVYTDDATDHLFDSFQGERQVYYVAVLDGKVIGGSGIAEVVGLENDYCELCRMFLAKEGRGKGIGAYLMKLCIDFAKSAAYKHIYIETFANMLAARKLYEKSGFEYIDYRLGNSGHFSCDVTMLKDL